MAPNRRVCPYCTAEVASLNWHRHVKNCTVRTKQYHAGTKPISKESANITFWKCNQCQLHNYKSAKQCVSCCLERNGLQLKSQNKLKIDDFKYNDYGGNPNDIHTPWHAKFLKSIIWTLMCSTFINLILCFMF
eukprot:68219_1